MHNLKVNVMAENFEGGFGISMHKNNIFLVAKVDTIMIFDCETFNCQGKIPIKLLPTETREPNEIIGIC